MYPDIPSIIHFLFYVQVQILCRPVRGVLCKSLSNTAVRPYRDYAPEETYELALFYLATLVLIPSYLPSLEMSAVGHDLLAVGFILTSISSRMIMTMKI